ncbi:MAG TPA: ABC transporter ATP-binding protein [Gemmatimonadaceae bacterium]|nr:ABC transporter ATP-binding protein [Gemmatimonadaceae bacterium]
MIDVQGLVRRYPRAHEVVEVLRGVTFRVAPGEFVAIMGRSGSGKSTLLNILGFLDRPDGGSYRFEGMDLSGADDDMLSEIRNRKIGFVFQQFHLLERTSALRNVMLPLLYTTDDVPDGEARARRALEAVGLIERADHAPAELSGGEQQRVAIARALVNDPTLLLADEPTGNLDSRSAADVMRILGALRETGRTIALVTHDPTIARAADRVLTLEEGRIRSTGAESDVTIAG